MRLDKQIESLKDELISAVQQCVQFRSVKDVQQAAPGAPFGLGIQTCLEWTLDLGKNLGFEVKNVDGYAGQIDMGSGELLGILGHLDVVPEGEGWSVPPYSATIKDGKLFGRGTLDDKGPTIAVLYAMKAILDAQIPLNKRVRLILGTDEESGWSDMDYYVKHEELPTSGFAPDAGFPVIHAEKGILHLELSKDCPDLPHLISLSGGERANVVPDQCVVKIKGFSQTLIQDSILDCGFPEGVSTLVDQVMDDEVVLIVHGAGAHGSLPQQGKNAVLYALKLLQRLPLSQEEQSLVAWILDHPGKGFYGEGLNVILEDEPSGKLTLNLGILQIVNHHLRMIIDIRYPVTFKQEDILIPVEEIAHQNNLEVKILDHHAAHFVPEDSILVQALLKAYSDVTGREGYAYAIGGGTYAKVLPQGVAFGPLLPGAIESIHCADEYISIDNLLLTTKVYAEAILNLACQRSEVGGRKSDRG